jgi:hypothetical protein
MTKIRERAILPGVHASDWRRAFERTLVRKPQQGIRDNLEQISFFGDQD